jgi:glycosyltransferase involved in cell wall biosynthesis
VEITVLGGGLPPGAAPAGRVHFLGWKSQSEAAEILSGMDVLYCPYPFAADMEEVSKLSFPSKVVLYLAAGRPVLFHGPAYSSPADYLRRRDAGYLVTEQSASAVFGALCKLTDDPELYRHLGERAQAAFQADFTLETMRANLTRALGLPLPAAPAAAASPAPAPKHLPDVHAIFPITQGLVSRSLPVVRRARQLLQGAKRRLQS